MSDASGLSPKPGHPAAEISGGAPAAAGGATVLRCEGLRKSFKGRRVVDDVSVGITQGEVVGLLGPNGAGKTTTFYCMLGLETPDAGKVFLGDKEITHDPIYIRARRGISYLPQEASIFQKMSVEQNLLAILETLPIGRLERRERLDALLTDLGLQKVRRGMGYQLSGGERRRTEIARALVTRPAFLLLDEPFAGIDPRAVEDIQAIIRRLADRGIGILITDHNVRETLKITQWACIINEGRILRHGRPADLAEDSEVRQVYLGDSFRLH